MRFLALVCANTRSHTPRGLSSLAQLTTSPSLSLSWPRPIRSKPELSQTALISGRQAHTGSNDPHTGPHTHITDHRRHRARRPDARVRTAARAVAASTGASTRVCAAPSAGRPRRRHSAATAAAASAPPPAAAQTRGYAAPRVPSPSSERHGAGRRRARARAALLLLQARRAAPATTPRRLSLGGVEVGRARSLPRARRSPPIRTRPWRPSRPARKPQSLPEVPPERRGESVAAVARPMAVRAGLIEARR